METDYFHSRVLRQYKITPQVEFSPIKHGLLLLLCCNIKRVSMLQAEISYRICYILWGTSWFMQRANC